MMRRGASDRETNGWCIPPYDPQWRNARGERIRESRDSDVHPTATSIAVMFDVTGSMGSIPVVLQKKLPELLGLLPRKAYVTDPQILFGAVGDATCDRVPSQVGQFESDNRMDAHLGPRIPSTRGNLLALGRNIEVSLHLNVIQERPCTFSPRLNPHLSAILFRRNGA